ncbi:MAG TPA: hypothetical protein VEG61_05745 [Candidatus Dormibacteraeota bacterium]|nr:hypothetical protein [Candidatus Dormibacteraeota bacterium]
MSKSPIGMSSVTRRQLLLSKLEDDEVLRLHRTFVLGTMVLIFLLQIRLGYTKVPLPVIPPGFVEITGPHGVSVLVGPLLVSPTGGYEREVILPGQPPFYVNTAPGVTPQEIAYAYG